MSYQLKQLFSEEEVNKIANFIDSELKTKERIKSAEVYVNFQFTKTKMNEISFCSALSSAIKSDVFPGLEIKRGRYGGIRLKKTGATKIVTKMATEPETKPNLSATPIQTAIQSMVNIKIDSLPQKEEVDSRIDQSRIINIPKVDKSWTAPKKNNLFIDGKQYISTMTNVDFKTIVERVFELKPSESKFRIVFGENKYDCTDEQADMFDKLLFYCFGAHIRISSKENPKEAVVAAAAADDGAAADGAAVIDNIKDIDGENIFQANSAKFIRSNSPEYERSVTTGSPPEIEWDE